MHGHKTFTLTTELQEQGIDVPNLLKVGFEPTTKGCLGCTKFGRLRHFLVYQNYNIADLSPFV